MTFCPRAFTTLALLLAALLPVLCAEGPRSSSTDQRDARPAHPAVMVTSDIAHDVSPRLVCESTQGSSAAVQIACSCAPSSGDEITAASVEQKEQGTKAAAEIVASFDGLGDGFQGPQGTAVFRNPSD